MTHIQQFLTLYNNVQHILIKKHVLRIVILSLFLEHTFKFIGSFISTYFSVL